MRRSLFYQWTLAGLLIAAALAAQEDARITFDDTGRWTLRGLPAILDDEEVERHLASGLTTSFVVQARETGSKREGLARIDVRLELWDEIYLVTVIDGEGGVREFAQPSEEALRSWWSSADVVLTLPPEGGARTASEARVSLDVIPFSQAEVVDTQRWLVGSIGQARPSARAGRDGAASRAVDALIATSIQRRVTRSWVWKVRIKEDRGR